MAKQFFDEQAEHSQIKTAIIVKYFNAWAQVITGHQKRQGENPRIAYIDLFAGPGRYKDGAKSTPVFILEQAIADPLLCNSLVTMFNDKDKENSSSLEKAIKEISGIATLRHEPEVYTEEVGEDIVKMFEEMNMIPTLMFIDPWGYKGLSLRLINSVLKSWACECVFFFNYNRINMGLANELVKEHMDELFGVERGGHLREKLEGIAPNERELTIVEELCKALIDMGGKYVLPFGFKNNKGTRTKHHLIFVSKNSKGYDIMKRVMANESSSADQGVPSFEYSPATKAQPLLFELTRPLDDLGDLLMERYAGRTLTMNEIYQDHNYGTRYIEPNYKAVLAAMELADKIKADPPHTKRPKRLGQVTFGPKVKVTFPNQKKGEQ
jgi:three-Cys-motif partner protein